jgi:hypothetical protein
MRSHYFGAEAQLLTISEEKAKGQEKRAARRNNFTTLHGIAQERILPESRSSQ